jgi:hypothetical protein
MAYIRDIADSLARVLEHGTTLSPHRVAGYAANAEFWLIEVEHCFGVLDGYSKRFRAMRAATDAYVVDQPLDPERADSDTRTTKNLKDFEVTELRESVATAARGFFRRCAELSLLSDDLLRRADQLLNLEYDDSLPHQTV